MRILMRQNKKSYLLPTCHQPTFTDHSPAPATISIVFIGCVATYLLISTIKRFYCSNACSLTFSSHWHWKHLDVSMFVGLLPNTRIIFDFGKLPANISFEISLQNFEIKTKKCFQMFIRLQSDSMCYRL